METPTLGQFLADRLSTKLLSEWDMPPESFDFEIRHYKCELPTAFVKSLILEYFSVNRCQCRIDDNLVGVVTLATGEYVINVSNYNYHSLIRGTLQRF